MNTRVRTALQTMRTPPKHDKEMEKEKTGNQGKSLNRIQSRRERKTALQQDVDKLKKKLRHEENVHRALERAFTRPLGALPRLPPYLPSHTLELLAEVAVLEEEVVRLEEQVVNFRQGLYQEAIYISSSKKTKENSSDLYSDQYPSHNPKDSASLNASFVTNPSPSMRWPSDGESNGHSSKRFHSGKKPLKKGNSCSTLSEDRRGKENQLNTNSTKNSKQSPVKKVPSIKIPVQIEKLIDSKSLQSMSDEAAFEESSGPNRLSEDILKCLLSIFSQMSSTKNAAVELETPPSISGSYEGSEEISFQDPYGICLEFGRRDVGPYKNFRVVEASSIDPNLITGSSFLIRRLKLLLRRLSLVDLAELTHQQKLAFWINMYNACMMNAFLENGIPATPHMVVALMPKAMVNVGGHLLSAMAIEHFILRLPYHSKHTSPKGVKNDEMAARGVFGLDWPEPLVTFALSCGSWSSPAVRVYTASQVENQLETAKQEYLQAAIGISMPNKLAIPKLLDWYLLDFAKDVESLMDWICLQLPSELRNEAVKCVEVGRRNVVQQPIQVLPYEFRFRYLLAP